MHYKTVEIMIVYSACCTQKEIEALILLLRSIMVTSTQCMPDHFCVAGSLNFQPCNMDIL